MSKVEYYQNMLNRNSKSKDWRYIPSSALDVLVNEGKGEKLDPLCLIGFDVEPGVDPYYGLYHDKRIYYIRENKKRNTLETFVNTTGVHFEPMLRKELGSHIADQKVTYYPKFGFEWERKVLTIPSVPPVDGGSVTLNIKAEVTPLHTVFADMSELNVAVSDGNWVNNAKKTYDHAIETLKPALGDFVNGMPQKFALKSDWLLGENNTGIFSGEIDLHPDDSSKGFWRDVIQSMSPGGMQTNYTRFKITAEGKGKGSNVVEYLGEKWQIDFELTFSAEATLDFSNKNFGERNALEFVTIENLQPATAGSILQRRVGFDRAYEWVGDHKWEVAAVAGIAAVGVVCIIFAPAIIAAGGTVAASAISVLVRYAPQAQQLAHA